MSSVYNWADDGDSGMTRTPPYPTAPPRPTAPPQQPSGQDRATRAASAAGAAAGGFVGGLSSGFVPPVNVNLNGRGGSGGNGGRGGGAAPAGATGSNHKGDGMIHAIERIEFRNEKDIITLAKAVNRLGRELHFILSMRAEEVQAVLSQYKGAWYTFGASSRVKSRLVAAHLKVSAEAAKALGVGSLKMAHAFDRHFIKPEQEAKRKKNGQKTRREFTIGGD
ncbi:hypothetical protein [Streptomyces ziwulingensis]|uniref:Uncharacterized protein n=1 Tax=Streptomyces ziwulingensis TaxID=1045501 RepID=A0ABP9D5R3_9ACTN